MFTLEESALLGFMLRIIGWLLIFLLVGGAAVAGIHLMHTRHHTATVHRA